MVKVGKFKELHLCKYIIIIKSICYYNKNKESYKNDNTKKITVLPMPD